jgi:hypothetical protein
MIRRNLRQLRRHRNISQAHPVIGDHHTTATAALARLDVLKYGRAWTAYGRIDPYPETRMREPGCLVQAGPVRRVRLAHTKESLGLWPSGDTAGRQTGFL